MPQPVETKIYADYLLTNKPDAKIAVIYQNDDLGKGNPERQTCDQIDHGYSKLILCMPGCADIANPSGRLRARIEADRVL